MKIKVRIIRVHKKIVYRITNQITQYSNIKSNLRQIFKRFFCCVLAMPLLKQYY